MDGSKQSFLDIMEALNRRMDEFEGELQKTPPVSTPNSLVTDFAAFKAFTMQILRSLHQQIEMLSQTVDRQEMHLRRKMLLFHGIKEEEQDIPKKAIENIVSSQLKILNFNAAQINRCVRMGRLVSDKPRPILVEFSNADTKNSIWFSKKSLKGTGITVAEFLTRPRHQAFMEVRKQYGVSKCWTRDGNIHFITPDGGRHRISSLAELKKITPTEHVKAPPVVAPKEDVIVSSKTRSARAAASRK